MPHRGHDLGKQRSLRGDVEAQAGTAAQGKPGIGRIIRARQRDRIVTGAIRQRELLTRQLVDAIGRLRRGPMGGAIKEAAARDAQAWRHRQAHAVQHVARRRAGGLAEVSGCQYCLPQAILWQHHQGRYREAQACVDLEQPLLHQVGGCQETFEGNPQRFGDRGDAIARCRGHDHIGHGQHHRGAEQASLGIQRRFAGQSLDGDGEGLGDAREAIPCLRRVLPGRAIQGQRDQHAGDDQIALGLVAQDQCGRAGVVRHLWIGVARRNRRQGVADLHHVGDVGDVELQPGRQWVVQVRLRQRRGLQLPLLQAIGPIEDGLQAGGRRQRIGIVVEPIDGALHQLSCQQDEVVGEYRGGQRFLGVRQCRTRGAGRCRFVADVGRHRIEDGTQLGLITWGCADVVVVVDGDRAAGIVRIRDFHAEEAQRREEGRAGVQFGLALRTETGVGGRHGDGEVGCQEVQQLVAAEWRLGRVGQGLQDSFQQWPGNVALGGPRQRQQLALGFRHHTADQPRQQRLAQSAERCIVARAGAVSGRRIHGEQQHQGALLPRITCAFGCHYGELGERGNFQGDLVGGRLACAEKAVSLGEVQREWAWGNAMLMQRAR